MAGPNNDPLETIVAGSGQVYVAPLGTALPTTATGALNAAFLGLGYHTEDGVSVSSAPELVEHRAWQARLPIRRVRDTETFTITFSLLQWNEANVPLAFGGGTVVSDGASGYRYNPPTAADAIDERAIVCDVTDGASQGRFVVPRGNTVEAAEASFTRTEMAALPISFSALEAEGEQAWFFLTNSTHFAPGT